MFLFKQQAANFAVGDTQWVEIATQTVGPKTHAFSKAIIGKFRIFLFYV